MSFANLRLPVAGDRFGLESATGGVLGVVRLFDGETVGTMTLAELPAGGLFVRALCIRAEHRGYGAGSEAVRLFNRACEEAGVDLIRASAPPDRGLAVYFWIRMGYRPLGGEGPDGGLWFERRPMALSEAG